MTLYSLNGAWPKTLPHRIKLSNGLTKTDPTTFTLSDIADAGYVRVDTPPTVKYPNKLEWDGETLQWSVREPNDMEIAEKWQEIKDNCVRLLESTDYKVIKAMEAGVTLETELIEYRQALRDLYNNVNNVDPWNVQYPTLAYNTNPYETGFIPEDESEEPV